MIGIVIVAHGGLAAEMLSAMEHVVGRQANAKAVEIAPTDDLRVKQAEIDEAVVAVDQGDGVVLVTDMFGGTPSNLAMGALTRDDLEVVYGANLPALVKLAKMRSAPLPDAVACAIDAGRKYLDSAGRILSVNSAS